MPNQDLEFIYNAGLLWRVKDNARQRETGYGYDGADRRNHLAVQTLDGLLVESINSEQDGMNRTIWVRNNEFVLRTAFDAARNRRYNIGTLNIPNPPIPTQSWFRYGVCDEVLVSDGELVNGAIVTKQNHGMELSYKDGRRHGQYYYDDTGEHTTYLNYSDEGVLTNSDTYAGKFPDVSQAEATHEKQVTRTLYADARVQQFRQNNILRRHI